MKKNVIVAAVAAAVLSACGGAGEKSEKLSSVDWNGMDTTVSPKEDFYRFANGNWMKNNPVPESESRWGSFNEVKDRNNDIIKEILNEASKNDTAEKGSATQLVGDYYYCIMDKEKRAVDGIAPIQSQLDKIDGLTKENLETFLADFHKTVGSTPFGFSIFEDLKDNEVYAVYLGQHGLGLPDKEYYFKQDEKSVETRAKYVEHVDKMFALANVNSKDAGKKILAIETELAGDMMNRVEQRDISKLYNKMAYADIKKQWNNFNWDKYFSAIGVTDFDSVIVMQPKYMAKFNKAIKNMPLSDWKLYFKWELINAMASTLTPEMEQQNFAFYSQYMRGAKEMKEDWKRAIDAMTSSVGDVMGKAFVEKAFSPEAKEKINALVDNLQAALGERLEQLEWMSDSTKLQAKEKMASFTRKLGYPDEWKDMSSLNISRESYAANKMAVNQWQFKDMLDKYGKPVDKTEWGMPAHMVNAYYNPIQNEIVFPAGIMQPPFFDPNAEDAVNYARIGAVIGHEMIHGFDDQGARFDATGLFKNWWTKEDLEKFKAQTGILVEQYNQYTPIEGNDEVKVNGELTLGENIADFGGLTIAYYAFQKSLEGKKEEEINGFTPEQRFFIAFGQIWKGNARDEYLRTQVQTDPHSPTEFRVNGTLSNMPEFFAAFNVEEGDPMRQPAEKIATIW
ncbi:M13 family metallopeptidase [Luteibaculum oceani]|uniref:M13 family metallopeptidase n=1 Tax=Luteibaculum oceani TaxID=1294296 RepID=A0A5C6VI51_9FLAO|nr:M13 family metallopeptidase [Luteibaculum oceani]TXC85132.1 M13 family metallopeptidase [Luteibaculum oceani]